MGKLDVDDDWIERIAEEGVRHWPAQGHYCSRTSRRIEHEWIQIHQLPLSQIQRQIHICIYRNTGALLQQEGPAWMELQIHQLPLSQIQIQIQILVSQGHYCSRRRRSCFKYKYKYKYNHKGTIEAAGGGSSMNEGASNTSAAAITPLSSVHIFSSGTLGYRRAHLKGPSNTSTYRVQGR